MSLFSGTPTSGDVVRLRHPVKTTLTDHLLGGDHGIPAGSRAVVLESTAGFLTGRVLLELENGTHIRVSERDVRVVGSGTIEAFRRSAERRNAARIGVAVALLAPLAWFAIQYWTSAGASQAGFLEALIMGAFESIVELAGWGITHPLQGAMYLLLLAWAGRFAFGR